MNYTIENFWISRLAGSSAQSKPTLAGWAIESTLNPSFVEADLSLRSATMT